MRLARAVLIVAGMALFAGNLWTASFDPVRLSGDEVRAQELGIGRVHLPVVARGVPVGGVPSDPMPWRPDADFVLGGPAWTVDVVGDVAFVGVGAHLMAYDIGGEEILSLLGASPPLPGSVRDVVVSDGFAFAAVHQTTELADAPGGLFVLDVSDPSAIEVVATRELLGGATDLDLDGNRVVVTAMSEYGPWPAGATFAVFDVSNPRQPELIRQAPKGGFWGDGEIALRDETVLACVEGLLFAADMTLPIDSWFGGRELAPCSAMARIGSDALLAVVSDSEEPGSYVPILRIFDVRDISMIELIGETPLDASGGPDAWINPLEVRVVGSSVYIAALIDESQSGIFHFDVSDPTSPRAVVTWSGAGALMWSGEGAILSVDTDGGHIVTGAAIVAGGLSEFPDGSFDLDPPNVVGSRIEVLEDDGDGSLRSLAHVDGPGTLLSTVACHDATSYVFEIGTGDSGIGRLWALSNTDDMPGVIAIMEFPQSENILDFGARGVAASTTGLFVQDRRDRISRYQVRDGRFESMGALDDEGTLAVSGDNLFVLDQEGELRVYDVSVPDSWRSVTALELPRFGRSGYGLPAMIASKNRLWMTTTTRDPFSTPVILADISDVTDLRLIGTLDIATESGGPEFTWLREGDGDVWLMTTGWDFGSRTTISTLTESPDDSGVVLDERWISDTSPESKGFPWALAVLEDRAWYVSAAFVHWHGTVHAVERTGAGHLELAGTRAAPAAVRSRSTENYDNLSKSYGALSLATCGDRIFGTDLEGGLYGIDPERWLEGAGGHISPTAITERNRTPMTAGALTRTKRSSSNLLRPSPP